MITIIFAPPRTGKTAFMTYLMCERAFDTERNRKMQKEIKERNEGGFSFEVPDYSVASNYSLICRHFGYTPRPALRINPYTLGFCNHDVSTTFLAPYTTIAISEAQKYFNSRRFKEYPDWQSRFYEQHGHNFLDFYLDTQRPNLIDINIRELSNFIEIISMNSTSKSITWKIRVLNSAPEYDCYVASGKKDKDTFEEKEVTTKINVFNLYDSRECKPLFYAGHFKETYFSEKSKVTEPTLDGYKEYIKAFGNELPEKFYNKR